MRKNTHVFGPKCPPARDGMEYLVGEGIGMRHHVHRGISVEPRVGAAFRSESSTL